MSLKHWPAAQFKHKSQDASLFMVICRLLNLQIRLVSWKLFSSTGCLVKRCFCTNIRKSSFISAVPDVAILWKCWSRAGVTILIQYYLEPVFNECWQTTTTLDEEFCFMIISHCVLNLCSACFSGLSSVHIWREQCLSTPAPPKQTTSDALLQGPHHLVPELLTSKGYDSKSFIRAMQY